MITLEEARENIGRTVRYESPGGETVEYGEIHSVGEHFIFVRYGRGDTAAATNPERLDWAVELTKPRAEMYEGPTGRVVIIDD